MTQYSPEKPQEHLETLKRGAFWRLDMAWRNLKAVKSVEYLYPLPPEIAAVPLLKESQTEDAPALVAASTGMMAVDHARRQDYVDAANAAVAAAHGGVQ